LLKGFEFSLFRRLASQGVLIAQFHFRIVHLGTRIPSPLGDYFRIVFIHPILNTKPKGVVNANLKNVWNVDVTRGLHEHVVTQPKGNADVKISLKGILHAFTSEARCKVPCVPEK